MQSLRERVGRGILKVSMRDRGGGELRSKRRESLREAEKKAGGEIPKVVGTSNNRREFCNIGNCIVLNIW